MTNKNRDIVGQVLSMAELEKRLDLNRTTILRMVRNGEFPKPFKLGARRIGWRDTAIDEWLRSREAGAANG